MLRSSSAVLLVLAGSPSVTEPAQNPSGIVVGTVYDSAGLAITGVEIGVAGTQLRTRSDDVGQFRLAGTPVGSLTLHARRLGFRPETLSVFVLDETPATVALRLRNAVAALPPVVVRGGRRRHTGRLAGFYERMESGTGGYFITRERIEEGDPRYLTNVLQRVPGIEVVRGTRVRMRGRQCAPLVWLDGVALPSGEVDLNSFPPTSIEGIELYPSASGAPIRYTGTRDQGRCGTILLWSRGPDTELRRRLTVVDPAVLERRHADREVYTAAEVDVRAQVSDAAGLSVGYPPELLAHGTTGLVIAEVVVDSDGKVEAGTFGLLSSSHPLFARAVKEALERAAFDPARLKDRPVPQIVQMHFRFEAPGRAKR